MSFVDDWYDASNVAPDLDDGDSPIPDEPAAGDGLPGQAIAGQPDWRAGVPGAAGGLLGLIKVSDKSAQDHGGRGGDIGLSPRAGQSPEQACEALGGTPLTYSGAASVYGTTDGFAHKTTANGERMDPSAMTAASLLTPNANGRLTRPLLPLGSQAYVTNAYTGQGANVRINDDGPLKPGRIIDSSPAAMKRLNNGTADGTIPVKVVRCIR